MSVNLLPREAGVGQLVHPDPMRVDGLNLDLIVDPLLKPITHGDTIFGWEGDPRLAVYFNPFYTRWELWRYENDGVYRLVNSWSASQVRAVDLVPIVIQFLVSHDQRRGYNVQEDVMSRFERLQSDAKRVQAEELREAAERVAWGLRKDLK